MAAKSYSPQKPMSGIIITVALALMCLGFWHGYPGFVALWAGLAVSAWTYPPAQYTGKKDSRGYPTAAHEGEKASMAKYRFWDDLRFRILVPSGDALPGWPLLLSWVAAAIAASAAYYIPVTDPYTQGYGPLASSYAVFMMITAVNGAKRRTMVEGDVNPGVRLDAVISLFKKNPSGAAALGFGGVVLGGALAVAAEIFRPVWVDFANIPTFALFPIMGCGGLLLTLGMKARKDALEKWQTIVAARAEWEPRWAMLKMDPAPRLVDRVQVSDATIDTFEAPGSMGAMAFWQMAPKITPTIGAGMEVHTLDVPDQDGQGQPIEGSRHPLRFDVVFWPAGTMPNPADPSVDEDLITLQARVALAIACDEGSLSPRYIFGGVQRLTAAPSSGPAAPASVEGQIVPWSDPEAEQNGDPVNDDSPAVWALRWHHPDGASARDFRVRCTGAFAGAVGSYTVVDHRAENGNGILYYGALGDPGVEIEPGAGVTMQEIQRLEGEDLWDSRWASASSKIGPNAPIVQWDTEESGKLSDGTVVQRLAFVSRQGVTVEQLFEPENHFPSVLQAAPFVAMTGYPGAGRRPGDRHPMAVAVHWSSNPVPESPDKIAPVPGSQAPEWVLAGRLNEAFKAAKLSRPELARATCLTERRSNGHLWKLEVRLYGGNTLADVRTAARRIQAAWSAEWLRVAEAPDGCIIVAGANPRRVKLTNPKRDELYLESLNWAQVFLDSGLTGIGGKMPLLTGVGSLPKNQQVQILDFDISGTGLDFTSFTGARKKLESNSANSFVEPRRVKNKPTDVQLLASEVNPMPEHAPYDYEAIDAAKGVPFSTGIEGEPIEFSIKDHIHLLVVGGSGSGKSVILQSLITGSLARDCDIYVADPTKGAADFKFAEPYAKAFCTDLLSTGAMMKGVYAEVKRRVALNTKHGVGSYRGLPDEVRPKHIVVVLDEFTSLIAPDAVPKPSEDPEIEAERDMAIAINASKSEVGAFTAKIAREARSAGVTLMLATQKLVQKDLDNLPGGASLKVNLSRLIAGKSTFGERMSALKDAQNAPEMGDSIPPGRAIFEPVTSGPVLIQCWYDKREQQALAEYVALTHDPLSEDEKLDLSLYAPKGRNDDEQFGGLPAEPVVDLGEMEIKLDDLDLGEMEIELDDLELADEEEATASPAHATLAALPDDADSVMFLDVDGTLCPMAPTGGTETFHVPGSGTVLYNPSVPPALDGIPVLWASDRECEASEHLTALVPSATGHLPYTKDTYGWWKIDAAEAWLREHPAIKRVAWMDDLLGDEDALLGVPYADIARDVFEAAGVQLLSVVPDSSQGLNVEQIETAAAWMRGPGPAPGTPAPGAAAGRAEEARGALMGDAPAAGLDDLPSHQESAAPDPAPRVRRKPAKKAGKIPFDDGSGFDLDEPVEPPSIPEAEFNLGVRRSKPAPKRPTSRARRTAPPAQLVDSEDMFEKAPAAALAFEDDDLFA